MKHLVILTAWLMLVCLLPAQAQTGLTQTAELYSKKLVVMLPDNYKKLTYTELAKRYDGANPPNYVYSGPESSINLVFNNSYVKAPTTEAEMQQVIDQTKISLEQSYPALAWKQAEAKTENGVIVGKMEFKSLTPENVTVYNIMYLVGVNGQLVVANFNCECPYDSPSIGVGRQILASMKVVE